MKTFAKYATIAVAFAPLLSLAAGENPTQFGLQPLSGAPTTVGGVWAIVQTLMNWFVAIFFLYATIQFVLAGIAYISSKGEEKTVSDIRNRLLYGIIGVMVGLLAFSIPRIVQSLIGVTVTG